MTFFFEIDNLKTLLRAKIPSRLLNIPALSKGFLTWKRGDLSCHLMPVRAYKQLSIHYHHDREIHQYAATSGYVHKTGFLSLQYSSIYYNIFLQEQMLTGSSGTDDYFYGVINSISNLYCSTYNLGHIRVFNLIHHSSGHPICDREFWDALGHQRSRSNRAAFPYRNTGQDSHSFPKPTVVTYGHRSSVNYSVTA